MKRTVIPIILTAASITAAALVPDIYIDSLPVSDVTYIKNVEYAESVTASGEIVKLGSKIVTADVPVVIKRSLVKRNQAVETGEPVAEIDRMATAKYLAEQYTYADLTEYGISGAQSYNDIFTDIPEFLYAVDGGVVDSVNISEGTKLLPGNAAMSLSGSDSLAVKISVRESDISKVCVGQKAVITGNGFPDKEYFGYVEEISGSAEKELFGTAQETVVKAVVRFSNADEKIRVGYSAKVKIYVAENETVEVIPYNTVLADNNGKEYVYVFNGGVAVRKDIETGRELSGGVEVKNGISPADAVLEQPDGVSDGGYVVVASEEEK